LSGDLHAAGGEVLAHGLGVLQVRTHDVVVLVDEAEAVPEDGGGELGWDAVEVEDERSGPRFLDRLVKWEAGTLPGWRAFYEAAAVCQGGSGCRCMVTSPS